MEIKLWDWQWFTSFKRVSTKDLKTEPKKETTTGISPGRVSEPEDSGTLLSYIQGQTTMVTPSFRKEVIPLIRNLYKVNPDISIAIQDMFKLANTGHQIIFPYNTDAETVKMREHLASVTKKWSNYTAGIDGLVNKMIVQCLVGGAISVEGVPNNDLSGLSTILFINPENIMFKRENNGVYSPYQINTSYAGNNNQYIKLNTRTYKYCGMFNDTDEPYGIPPFISALDSVKTQADMKINMKQILELMGMIGFLEAKMEKPAQMGNESTPAYTKRLTKTLMDLKTNLIGGMKDGLVTGYIDDHEFELHSTSSSLDNVDKLWNMNQQSLANGLSINGSIIGVNSDAGEGAAGIALSKMISQLRNVQTLVSDVLSFLYSLELLLAGFNNKGLLIRFNSSTISDEVKVQQGLEYKIRNLKELYIMGTISENDFAFDMGYAKPDKPKPRVPITSLVGKSSGDAKKEEDREKKKDTSDRKTRTKEKKVPKRKDQNTKPS